jgi:hypothetical protein
VVCTYKEGMYLLDVKMSSGVLQYCTICCKATLWLGGRVNCSGTSTSTRPSTVNTMYRDSCHSSKHSAEKRQSA